MSIELIVKLLNCWIVELITMSFPITTSLATESLSNAPVPVMNRFSAAILLKLAEPVAVSVIQF